jgi:putative phosphoribosyl transferase
VSAAATAVRIPVGAVSVDGDLTLSDAASGVVVFAHGSGSSRHSPRNRYVAEVLRQARLATLLLDLLTPEEDATDERTARIRFDIALLAERLILAVDWLREREDTAALLIGCFGASTGAAAALIAAAERPRAVATHLFPEPGALEQVAQLARDWFIEHLSSG